MRTDVTLIAAHSLNRAIGKEGAIPWHSAEDFAHFKHETMGATLIMGRATWDSIGRPLPGRQTIVVTRQKDWAPAKPSPLVHVAASPLEALKLARTLKKRIMVAGGAQLYRELMPYASHQILTTIPVEVEGADAFYPEFSPKDWTLAGTRRQEDLVFNWYVRKGLEQAW